MTETLEKIISVDDFVDNVSEMQGVTKAYSSDKCYLIFKEDKYDFRELIESLDVNLYSDKVIFDISLWSERGTLSDYLAPFSETLTLRGISLRVNSKQRKKIDKYFNNTIECQEDEGAFLVSYNNLADDKDIDYLLNL